MIEKSKKKLEGRKRTYLSEGGRLKLFKATMSNLSVYFLSLFLMPKDVARRLQTTITRFLWGDTKRKKIPPSQLRVLEIAKGVRRLGGLNHYPILIGIALEMAMKV